MTAWGQGRVDAQRAFEAYESRTRAAKPWPDWAWWPDAVSRYNDWARESERERLLGKLSV